MTPWRARVAAQRCVAAARAGILVLRRILSTRPARQLNFVVRPRPLLGALHARFPVARRLRARSHVRMASFPTINEFFTRLHAAGWSVGDVRILTAEGPRWLVTGRNGENQVRATGRTQAEAWHRACQQAEAAGMLGRRPSSCLCRGRWRE